MKRSARILVSLLSLLTFTVCLSGVAAARPYPNGWRNSSPLICIFLAVR